MSQAPLENNKERRPDRAAFVIAGALLLASIVITVSTVNRWEKGHSVPSKLARASLARFAGRRGVAVESLLEDIDPGVVAPPRSAPSTN